MRQRFWQWLWRFWPVSSAAEVARLRALLARLRARAECYRRQRDDARRELARLRGLGTGSLTPRR